MLLLLLGSHQVPVSCHRQNPSWQCRSQLQFHASKAKSRLQQYGSRRRTRQARSIQAAASMVESLNGEQLEVALAERDRPLVIDFSANWCGPCLLLAQELEKVRQVYLPNLAVLPLSTVTTRTLVRAQVAKQLGDKVRLVKIDTDEHPELSSQLQIQGLPTMVFVGVDKSKPALRTEGLLPAETIIEIIENELS